MKTSLTCSSSTVVKIGDPLLRKFSSHKNLGYSKEGANFLKCVLKNPKVNITITKANTKAA